MACVIIFFWNQRSINSLQVVTFVFQDVKVRKKRYGVWIRRVSIKKFENCIFWLCSSVQLAVNQSAWGSSLDFKSCHALLFSLFLIRLFSLSRKKLNILSEILVMTSKDHPYTWQQMSYWILRNSKRLQIILLVIFCFNLFYEGTVYEDCVGRNEIDILLSLKVL